MKAEDVIETMESMLDSDQRTILMRFFKTAKGEYGEGDEFLGIKTPQTRKVVKECKSLPMSEVPTLLKNKWHEVRLCGLLILVDRFEAACKKKVVDTDEATATRDEIVQMYIHDTAASIARPIKELKGFRRIHLEPGEQKTVTFEVDEELLKFYNANLRHVAEPGEFTLMVGPNSEDLQSKTFVLE